MKWSLDRAVSIGGFATTQMNAGSLEKPEQFVAVDDKTFRLDYMRRDKLTMPNLAVTIPFVFDSELAIAQRRRRPLAKDYLKNNIAGGGAFKVEAWRPGTETIYTRNDDWKSRPAAQAAPRHRPRHPLAEHPPRADRARRRRYLLRPAAEGLQGPGGSAGRSASPPCRSRTPSGTSP